MVLAKSSLPHACVFVQIRSHDKPDPFNKVMQSPRSLLMSIILSQTCSFKKTYRISYFILFIYLFIYFTTRVVHDFQNSVCAPLKIVASPWIKIASSPPNISRIKEICSSLQSLCPRHAPNWNQYMVQPQPPKVSLCLLCLEPEYGSTPARSVLGF